MRVRVRAGGMGAAAVDAHALPALSRARTRPGSCSLVWQRSRPRDPPSLSRGPEGVPRAPPPSMCMCSWRRARSLLVHARTRGRARAEQWGETGARRRPDGQPGFPDARRALPAPTDLPPRFLNFLLLFEVRRPLFELCSLTLFSSSNLFPIRAVSVFELRVLIEPPAQQVRIQVPPHRRDRPPATATATASAPRTSVHRPRRLPSAHIQAPNQSLRMFISCADVDATSGPATSGSPASPRIPGARLQRDSSSEHHEARCT